MRTCKVCGKTKEDTEFYNLVIAFNSKVILILVSINAVLQIITLIIK